jgi:EAL domain-containing protein (putative c-di-GMP-specific phosphodiesterase class I)/FixJ family two-component response regulator
VNGQSVNIAAPHGARILLLDDDPLLLLLLSRMLKQLGYTNVVACSNGEEALRQLGNSGMAVDVIMLDINMPEMDGIEFIRRLAACRYTGSLILVSGESGRVFDSVARLIEAQQLCALGHLHKPVQPEQLAVLLGRLKRNTGQGMLQSAAPHAYQAAELRAAIAGGQLINHYQPKVTLATGEFVGVECLVRWQHPRDGLVFPDQFIGLATGLGLIAELTRAVVSAALQQARAWGREGYRVPVAINVTMDDLTALDFPDVIEALAAAAGIEPQLITLEVTEGQMQRNLSTVLDVLSRLQLKRFQMAIDDFGTGHSSLAQLRDLPFDELKIDRGFVHGATADTTRQAICIASIRMAHQLRMQVVAEGIETRDDWDLMRHLGCDAGQGYFIARPMPAAALLDWLTKWQAQCGAAIPLHA